MVSSEHSQQESPGLSHSTPSRLLGRQNRKDAHLGSPRLSSAHPGLSQLPAHPPSPLLVTQPPAGCRHFASVGAPDACNNPVVDCTQNKAEAELGSTQVAWPRLHCLPRTAGLGLWIRNFSVPLPALLPWGSLLQPYLCRALVCAGTLVFFPVPVQLCNLLSGITASLPVPMGQ